MTAAAHHPVQSAPLTTSADAVQALRSAGLDATCSSPQPLRISGGEKSAVGGIRGFKNAFVIIEEGPRTFSAVCIQPPGASPARGEFDSLAKAIAFVIRRAYRSKKRR